MVDYRFRADPEAFGELQDKLDFAFPYTTAGALRCMSQLYNSETTTWDEVLTRMVDEIIWFCASGCALLRVVEFSVYRIELHRGPTLK